MNAEIILKDDEKEYLLQRTPEDSPARPVLAGARRDDNQPALLVFSCNEQAANALLEVAERHCDCAWRVMHYQMTRLGLLEDDRHRRSVIHKIAKYQFTHAVTASPYEEGVVCRRSYSLCTGSSDYGRAANQL